MKTDWEALDDLADSALATPRREIFLAIRTDGAKGDGSLANPYSAGKAGEFDIVMRDNVVANSVVRLGPGLFRTRGSQVWNVKSGVRIVGAGIFATTLRLTVQPVTAAAYSASCIARPDLTLVHGVEISDLTFDCNLSGQPNSPGLLYPKVSVGAVDLWGKNNRVRRIRVINFGTRTPFTVNGQPKPTDSWECFPCLVGGEGSLVEDCIFEQPFCGTGRETTIINCGSDSSITGLPTTVRNNYLNMDWVNPDNGFPTRVERIGWSGTTVTVRTRFPHNTPVDGYILMKGASDNAFNKRWLVTAITGPIETSRDLQFTMSPAPTQEPSGSITVEESFQPTLRVLSASRSGTVMTVNTVREHHRQQDDYIVISGADLNAGEDKFNGTYKVKGTGLSATSFQVDLTANESVQPMGEIWIDRRRPQTIRVQAVTKAPDGSNSKITLTFHGPHYLKPGEYFILGGFPEYHPLNSYFPATTVVNRLTIEFTVSGDPEIPSAYDVAVGPLFQAISHYTVPGATTERNRIISATTGGPYQDAWVQKDAISRKNYYYNVYNGPRFRMGASEKEFWPGSGKDERMGRVVGFTGGLQVSFPSNPINLRYPSKPVVGLVIQLFRCTMNQPKVKFASSTYVYYLPISAVDLNAGTFTVENPGGFALDEYIGFWYVTQTDRLVIEDNLIDLAHQPLPVYADFPSPQLAITTTNETPSYESPSHQYTGALCKRLFVRGNHIRFIDNSLDPHQPPNGNNTVGMNLFNAGGGAVENNILDGIPWPSNYLAFTAAFSNLKTFNNQTSGGIRMKMGIDQRYPRTRTVYEDIADDIDDWIMNW